MLTYNFENIGSDSLYEFLYKCIKNDIIQGIILSGEKLPSKRALAKNLAISVITVENAYGQLLAEGYIYSIPKSGYYVSDLSGIPVHRQSIRQKRMRRKSRGQIHGLQSRGQSTSDRRRKCIYCGFYEQSDGACCISFFNLE